MLVDAQLQFSNAQALTSGASASTNIIDLSSDRDIGPGEQLYILFTLNQTVAAGGTYQFDLETDDNTSFSSPTVIGTLTIAAATLVQGYNFYLPMPLGNERYLRTKYTLGGTSPTMNITAQIVNDVQQYAYYPVGWSVA